MSVRVRGFGVPEGKVQGVPPKEKVPKSINVRKRQFVATSER